MDWVAARIDIKSINDEQRIIEGVATTPTVDEGDDIVEPFGVKFQNPIPFLLHHNQKTPVGQVHFGRPTATGIPFRATIPKVVEPGIVQERTDEAWHSAKYGLLRGASIGYVPIKFDRRSTGGRHLKELKVYELSMVTVPMNQEATITLIKSLDAAALAASGRTDRGTTPGVPGSRTSGPMNIPISQQIETEQRDLEAKHARMSDLMTKSSDDGGLNAAESDELAGVTQAVEALTSKISRLRTMESAQAAMARPAAYQAPPRQDTKSADRGFDVKVVNLDPGIRFARYAMSVAAGKGSRADTLDYARRWDGDTPEISAYLKASWGLTGEMMSQIMAIKAIAGTATVGSPAWGGELAYPNNLASEFVELLRNATIIGRLPGLRNVPFNVRVGVQTGGSTVNWVGEGLVKPVGELAFTEATLTYSKVAGIVVLSDELVRLSTPSATQTVRDDLVAAIQEFIDQQMFDSTVTATSARPASLTNGVTGTGATGTTAADLRDDINDILLTPMDAADMSADNVVLLMPGAVARGIQSLTSTLGQPEFPSMTATGGTLQGFPVIVSNSIPAGNIIAVKADEVWLADDGMVTLDASNQATLDMAGSTSAVFSLWQRNCTAIRAERWIRWQKRRSAAVQRITSAAYSA